MHITFSRNLPFDGSLRGVFQISVNGVGILSVHINLLEKVKGYVVGLQDTLLYLCIGARFLVGTEIS